MEKLLIICGPTATGKTRLALSLAKKLNGEIVSADSRQVYRDLNIGTGKDLPPDAKYHWILGKNGYFQIEGTKIWGYDLIGPKEDFSVSQYLKFARSTISDIQKRKKLPIIVGGTGLYIKGIVDGIPTAEVPVNEDLREKLDKKSVDELFESLSQLDSIRAGEMNSSDKKNPRRLIRAIEISQYLLDHKNVRLLTRQIGDVNSSDTLFVGLTAPKEYIDKKIEIRVYERIGAGVKNEIKKLLKNGVGWHHQSMMSLGYRQWRDYFEGGVDEEIVVDDWIREERRYAKRQITWFKKDKRINWFDITDKEYPENVEKLAQRWYYKKHDEES